MQEESAPKAIVELAEFLLPPQAAGHQPRRRLNPKLHSLQFSGGYVDGSQTGLLNLGTYIGLSQF